MNNDKTTDLISISDDGFSLGVHYYYKADSRYHSKTYKLQTCKISGATFVPQESQVIVVCSEFPSHDYLSQVRIYNDGNSAEQGFESFEDVQIPDISLEKGSQPFFADVDLDGYADFLFNDGVGVTPTLKVSLFNVQKKTYTTTFVFWDKFVSTSPACNTPNNPPAITLRTPHFSAVADFDGDCVSDLFLTTRGSSRASLFLAVLEAKNGHSEVKYCLTDLSDTTIGDLTGHTVADFDGDAMIDIAAYDK